MQNNWTKNFEPLLKLYGKQKHPLDYKNRYQLIVMVILSARDTDKHINKIAESFFQVYPTMSALAKATTEELLIYLKSVSGHNNKSAWLIELAKLIKEDKNIPTTMDKLTSLPGIGRKSANVIIRESKGKAEGVIVDLHVVRVAPRIGIASGTQPDKIEKQLMNAIPDPEKWNELGMAISFLGREICRPSKPKCGECVMNKICRFYNSGNSV
jgi:endonuclease III